MNSLTALWNGRRMGTVLRRAQGRLAFEYDPEWSNDGDSPWLSLSMPATLAEHRHDAIAAFLWGLLPDNPHVLERWGRQFQVSRSNVFDLIARVGEDCAGAVQFVTPDREEAVLSPTRRTVDWLEESQIAERLRDLRRDASAWRRSQDRGQFSLAGAQPKTALFVEGNRFGIPSGRTPTTHILKPATDELFEGHVENEHFCLRLAGRMGLPVAHSEVRRFGDEVAIVVTRYDRAVKQDGRRGEVDRVHQEDVCQALGVYPASKYQNEGGPSTEHCIELIRDHSRAPSIDVATFVSAQIYNWLIGGTDAHAKNYSLLHGPGGRVRLAPLYDLASVLPYPGVDWMRAKLAMKIGGKYRLRDIGPRQWRKFENENRLTDLDVVDHATNFAARLPDEAAALARELKSKGVKHPIVARLADVLASRAKSLHRELINAARGGL